MDHNQPIKMIVKLVCLTSFLEELIKQENDGGINGDE